MIKPHVVLSMIVKDESAVIERCLRSVLPYIDAWVILDTGSSDDTMEKIQEVLADLPGELHQAPWKGMAKSRNEALALARRLYFKCQECDGVGYRDQDDQPIDCPTCDSYGFINSTNRHLMLIDADDTLIAEEGFEFPDLKQDAYFFKFKLANISFKRISLLRAQQKWHYTESAHEVLACQGPYTRGDVKGAHIQCGTGHRRSTQSPKEKYGKVCELLYKDLEDNPNNTRAMFYLAQSHRDAGEPDLAYEWYTKRAGAGGWIEERWYSHYQLGGLALQTQKPFEVVQQHYLEAYKLCPHRSEPLVALSALLRARKEMAYAHIYACLAKELPYPENDQLFVEDACYQWQALDEFAVTAYHVGRKQVAAASNRELLRRVPESQRLRILTNLAHCSGEPPPAEEALETKVVRRILLAPAREVHASYIEVVRPMQAPSAELSSLVAAIVQDGVENVEDYYVADLGGGLPTQLLARTEFENCVHVHTVFETKTEMDREHFLLLAREEERMRYPFVEIQSRVRWMMEAPCYDLILMKLGRTNPSAPDARVKAFPAVWSRLKVGGLLLLDDMHQAVYRAAVVQFLQTVPHERIEVKLYTQDSYGRFSWLIRKKDSEALEESA